MMEKVFALAVLLLLVPSVYGWNIESVLDRTAMTTDIVVSETGMPCIATGESYSVVNHSVFVYCRNATGWTPVMNFSTNITPEVAIRMDPGGSPHLFFSNPLFGWDVVGGLFYSKNGTRELIVNRVGYFISMDLINDTPFVAYADYDDNMKLYTASRKGGVWKGSKLTESSVGGTAVEFDSAGRPHVAYVDVTHDAVMHAHFNGIQWVFEEVFAYGNSTVFYVSMDLNGADRPAISYYIDGKIGLDYYNEFGVRKHTEIRDPIGPIVGKPSVKFASPRRSFDGFGGNIRIAYPVDHQQPWFNQSLRYAVQSGRRWSIQTIDNIQSTVRGVSLDIDSNQKAHISYLLLDPINFIRYATNG